MKTLLLTAVVLLFCACYDTAAVEENYDTHDGTDADAEVDTDAGLGLDCEQACDVDVLCNEFFDPEGAYVECLEICDYLNEQTNTDGAADDLDDAECVNNCYGEVVAGTLNCDTFSNCIFDCDPWWAQG